MALSREIVRYLAGRLNTSKEMRFYYFLCEELEVGFDAHLWATHPNMIINIIQDTSWW